MTVVCNMTSFYYYLGWCHIHVQHTQDTTDLDIFQSIIISLLTSVVNEEVAVNPRCQALFSSSCGVKRLKLFIQIHILFSTDVNGNT